MGELTLTLLGPFQVLLDGVPLRLLASNAARALLAYLAVEAGPPHRREALAALLWPEQPDREALARLRHTLSDLRHALGDDNLQPPFLIASRETLQLNPAAHVVLDVTTFARALSAMPGLDAQLWDHETIDRLERALALYRGSFLEGVAVNSAPFEEWALLKREQLHWQAVNTLRLLATAYEARAEYSHAQAAARRQLELQPWQEEAHRQLMRALALSGQRSAALAQYQSCVQRLAAELGAAPADETVALHQAIHDGKLAQPEVQRAGGARRRGRRQLSPSPLPAGVFVSRQGELAKLDGFLDVALAGQGRVALVRGMAGSGKTALLTRFSEQAMARHPDLVAARGNCNAHAGSGDPYLPFREILQLLSGEIEAHRAGGSLSAEHARRLWALLPATAQALLTFGPDLVGTFVPSEPLLRRIQAFAPDGGGRWGRLEALAERAAGGERKLASQADLFDQATQVLQAVAAQQPLLLLLDDLQWADRGSLALLFHLGRRLGEGRILVVGAYRSATLALGDPSPATRRPAGHVERHPLESVVHEFGREWGDIQVDLDQADGRVFVDAFLDAEPNRLDASFRETLYRHTGGNPLFTVELLRGLQDRGDLVRDEAGHWVAAPALHWHQLPARVEAVIAERLERLPSECQVLLRVASVEGEEFTAEVLAQVTGLGLSTVINHLSETLSKRHRLVRAAHLLRREPGGHYLSCYRFAHILFQRYVYDHLDEVARLYLHSCVAEALETLRREGEAGEGAGVQDPTAPVRLARHWEAAGEFERAAACLLQAGSRAAQLSAYEEAVHLFRRGLALVERLPEGPRRAQLEREIQVSLIRPLLPTQGWASAERARYTQMALDLARQQPKSEAELAVALYMRADVLTADGRYAESLDLAELLLHLAQRSGNTAYLALAYHLRGQNHLFSGDVVGCVADCQQALAAYDRTRHTHLLPWTGGDLGVACISLLALAYCYLGYPEQGLSCSRQALAEAQGMGHPLTEATALTLAGCAFHALRLEVQPVQEYASRLVALAAHKGVPTFRPYGLLFLAWAQERGGGGGPASAKLQAQLTAWRASGHRSGTSFLLAVVVDLLQRSGALDEAMSVVEEGLALATEVGAAHRAELYRLKGELLNERQPLAGAQPESCFRAAIEEARQRGLKLLELRATASLARLWAGSGRPSEARQLLAEIYGWFSEGLDTPDLRAAKAVLNTLA